MYILKRGGITKILAFWLWVSFVIVSPAISFAQVEIREIHVSSEKSDTSSHVSKATYMLELMGGSVGTLIGAVPSTYCVYRLLCTFFAEEGGGALWYYSSLLLTPCIPLGSAYGVSFAGKELHKKGSFKRALIGGITGAVVGAGLVAAANPKTTTPWVVSIFLGLNLGSVIGYNSSPKQK